MGTEYLEEAITEYWGGRCKDYGEGCPSCEAWKQFDELTKARELKPLSWRDRKGARGWFKEAEDVFGTYIIKPYGSGFLLMLPSSKIEKCKTLDEAAAVANDDRRARVSRLFL